VGRKVQDYDLLSIDWTPLHRAGMGTRVVYAGEMDAGEQNEGGRTMTWKEMAEGLRTAIRNGDASAAAVFSELAPVIGPAAGIGAAATAEGVKAEMGIAGKLREICGEMAPDDWMGSAQKALEAQARAAHQAAVEKAVASKVQGEMAQTLLRAAVKSPVGATPEEISGEIDGILADPSYKKAISKLYTDAPVDRGAQTTAPAGLKTRSARI
jgi:hypothetical protein